MLQRLALTFYGRETAAITFGEAQNLVRELKPPAGEVDAYVRDFLNCSFLLRSGDRYRFSHRSIMEYLAARALMNDYADGEYESWAGQPLTPGVTDFIREMAPKAEKLWEWAGTMREWLGESRARREMDYLGGNAATILCKLRSTALKGRDLSGAFLRSADLRFADLRGTRFAGAILRGVNISGAKFFKRELMAAQDIRDLTVSYGFIGTLLQGMPETEHIRRVMQKGQPLGVAIETATTSRLDDQHIVAALRIRVADRERLEWVDMAFTRESWIKVRALYWDQHEKITKTFGREMVEALSRLNRAASQ